MIQFKRNKNISNFLVRSAFHTSDQPGTFKCARARCKNMSFHSQPLEKMDPSDPSRSLISCTSVNVICCITCTLWKTGRRLGDRFRGHLRDAKKYLNPERQQKTRLNRSQSLKATYRYDSLRPFPTSRKHEKPQNSKTKTYLRSLRWLIVIHIINPVDKTELWVLSRTAITVLWNRPVRMNRSGYTIQRGC